MTDETEPPEQDDPPIDKQDGKDVEPPHNIIHFTTACAELERLAAEGRRQLESKAGRMARDEAKESGSEIASILYRAQLMWADLMQSYVFERGLELETLSDGSIDDTPARKAMRRYIDDVEDIEGQLKALREKRSETYKAAKIDGFDTPTMKRVVRLRKTLKDIRDEQEILDRIYMSGLTTEDGPNIPLTHRQTKAQSKLPSRIAKAAATARDINIERDAHKRAGAMLSRLSQVKRS